MRDLKYLIFTVLCFSLLLFHSEYAIVIERNGSIYENANRTIYTDKSFPKISVDNYNLEWYCVWGGVNSEKCGIELDSEPDSNMNLIALDSSENIYVAGTTNTYGTGFWDISLLKYSPSGNLLWNKTWGGSDFEEPKEVVIDSFDHIYITGITESYGNGNYDICLLKYESSGDLIWNKTWGGSKEDYPSRMVLDSSENIYIGGTTWSFGVGMADYCLIKYNAQGGLLWNCTYGFFDEGWCYDIAIDNSDNIYLTGDNAYRNSSIRFEDKLDYNTFKIIKKNS